MSKGRGWWGEPGRHRVAALKRSAPWKLQPPRMTLDGYVVVNLIDRIPGVSVRWADSLRAAVAPSEHSQVGRINIVEGGRAVTGDNQFLMPKGIPDTEYAVLEEDSDFVFLAALLHNNRASAKHRYLVTQKDWKKAIKKSGDKFF